MKLSLLVVLGLLTFSLTFAEMPSDDDLENAGTNTKPGQGDDDGGDGNSGGTSGESSVMERGFSFGWPPKPKPKPKPKPPKCHARTKSGSYCEHTGNFWFHEYKKCKTRKCVYTVTSGYLYCHGKYIHVPFVWPYYAYGADCVTEHQCAPKCKCTTKYCRKKIYKWVKIYNRYYKFWVWIRYPCGCECRKKFPFVIG